MNTRGRTARRILLAVFGVVLLIGQVAHALTPTLLRHEPIALALLDGRTPTLLLVVPRVDRLPFLLAATIGLFLAAPVAFAVGRVYGASANRWLGYRAPRTSRVFRWAERLIASGNGAPIVIFYGVAASAVAGASTISWAAFLVYASLAVTVRVAIIVWLGSSFRGSLEHLGDALARFSVPLTILTVTAVAVDYWIARRSRRLTGQFEDSGGSTATPTTDRDAEGPGA